MYYLLLPNGRGILKRDNTRLKTSVLKLAFEGASEKAIVTVCSSHNTFRTYLKNGEFAMDVSEVRGDIRITVKDDKMRWICDPVYVGESRNGEIFVATKTCYGELIANIVKDYEALKKELETLKQRLDSLEPKYDYATNCSDII